MNKSGVNEDNSNLNHFDNLLEKLVLSKTIYNQISEIKNNFVQNIKNAYNSVFSNNRENIDSLAKHTLHSNKIITMKISKLEKYALFLYQNNDVLFLNLTLRSIIIY